MAVALFLGACSSDPEPVEPTGRPTSSPSAAVTAPAMPDQAREDSPEGAAAFVKHYVDVFNYAASTGDVDELSRLSSPDCEGCQSYITLYRDTYKAGGYFKGGEWKLGKLLLEVTEAETFATTTVGSGGGRFRATSADPESRSTRASTELTFAVSPDAGRRRITQLALGDAQ